MNLKYFFYCFSMLLGVCTVGMIIAFSASYGLNIMNPFFIALFGIVALTTSGYIFTAKATENRYKNALYVSIILSLILVLFSVRKNNDITSIFSSFLALVITLQFGSLIHYLIHRTKKTVV